MSAGVRVSRILFLLCLPTLAWGVAACKTYEPDVSKPHHTEDGFRNNYPHDKHGFGDFLSWRWDRVMGRIPPQLDPEEYRFPLADNDPVYLRSNRTDTTLTWVGHASFLFQVGGVNILTDPQFSDRASPVSWAGPKRITAPGLALEDLPPIDLVLVSHNHYDHLDLDSLRRLNEQWAPAHRPRFIVPLGNRELLAGEGIEDVVELDWWEQAEFMGLTVHGVPAQHFSARSLFDRNEMLWAGWVVVHPKFRFFITGDTGYSLDFKQIGERLGPMDLSAITIGHYEPRWFMKAMHLNPREAVEVHRDVRSRQSVAMHWGTFALTDEPMDAPPKELAIALEEAGISSEEFRLMRHGETRILQVYEKTAAKAE